MKYSAGIVQEICKYLRAGSSQKDSAILSGIGEDTFYRWMKQKPKAEFSEPIKKAELECKGKNIAIIQLAAEKTWQAAAWYLERRYHDEYALKNVTEHQGSDKPIEIRIIVEDKHNNNNE